MKLLVLSDLHLEFEPFIPDPQGVAEADVAVLAGDIDKGVKGIRWAAEAFAGKPVIYVAGNHEFYDGHWDNTLAEMRAEAKALGIHFLENDSVEIDGLRVLGCTLWTDFDYLGREKRFIEGEDLRSVAADVDGHERARHFTLEIVAVRETAAAGLRRGDARIQQS